MGNIHLFKAGIRATKTADDGQRAGRDRAAGCDGVPSTGDDMGSRAGARPKTRLPPARQLENIMNAARSLILEKGYENTVVAEIAERAGVAEGTIYRYFENKRELLIKVAEAWFAEQLAEDPELPAIKGTWNKLHHFVWQALQITRRAPALTRFLLTELRPNPQFRESPFFELNRRHTAVVRGIIHDAVSSGEFRQDVSEFLLRDMVFGCIEHHTWAFLRGEGDFDTDEVARGITTIICRGMAAHPESDDGGSITQRLERIADRLESCLQPGKA
jgi:AcrR family transcriptional regulator